MHTLSPTGEFELTVTLLEQGHSPNIKDCDLKHTLISIVNNLIYIYISIEAYKKKRENGNQKMN